MAIKIVKKKMHEVCIFVYVFFYFFLQVFEKF